MVSLVRLLVAEEHGSLSFLHRRWILFIDHEINTSICKSTLLPFHAKIRSNYPLLPFQYLSSLMLSHVNTVLFILCHTRKRDRNNLQAYNPLHAYAANTSPPLVPLPHSPALHSSSPESLSHLDKTPFRRLYNPSLEM
jgi:hypothetical protein